VKHHVAITSTLPVFEDTIPGRPPLRQRVLEAMTPEAREAYLYNRERPATMKPPKNDWAMLFKRDMQMEKAFAAAGGLLLAGPDPTGDGGVVPGFGDQREIPVSPKKSRRSTRRKSSKSCSQSAMRKKGFGTNSS
jgi:hypothetical protein